MEIPLERLLCWIYMKQIIVTYSLQMYSLALINSETMWNMFLQMEDLAMQHPTQTPNQPTNPSPLIPWSASWSCWLICSKRSPVSHFFASVGYGPWIWNWRTPKWPEWPACFDIRLDHTINLSNKQVLDRTFCQKYLSFECVSKFLQMD